MRSRPPETEAGRGAFRLLKTGAERGEPRPPRAGDGKSRKQEAGSRKRKAERRKQETESRTQKAGNGKQNAGSRKREAERGTQKAGNGKQNAGNGKQNAERGKRHPGIQTGRSDLNGSDRLFDEYELRGYFSGESGSRAITR